MEMGKGGTSRQDKKILTTTLAKSLGDADLETRDGAYHRRDAFPASPGAFSFHIYALLDG